MLIEFLLAAFLPSSLFGYGDAVAIGGLLEEVPMNVKAFELSVRSLNEERRGRNKFSNQYFESKIATVTNDLYDTSESVCELANYGVATVFGPQNGVTAKYVQTMCDTMDIPHVAMRWDSQQPRGNGLVNMYPYSHTLSLVYLQLVKDYKWKTFTILYENTDSLIRLNQVLKRWDNKGHTATVKQLPKNSNYRTVFREIKQSGDWNIILDCSIEILPEVLKQAQQVGVMSDRYNYILTTLDLQTIDLEPYQYGGTNVTGFRLIDPDDQVVIETFDRDILDWGLDSPSQLTVEAALIYDGVQLFGRAYRELGNTIAAKKSLCENSESWEHGSTLLNAMRLTEIRGYTGLIKFDTSGYRSNFKLDVMHLNDNGLEKIAVWNSSNGIEYLPVQKLPEYMTQPSLHNMTFRVIITKTAPYGMLKESANMEVGNDRFEGFGVDIIQELSKILGFNYTFEMSQEAYGSKNPETGKWDGIIQKIMEDHVDLMISDLTITASRQEAVDFTMPFMNLGISVLFVQPSPAGSSLFSFLMPFSSEVWMYLMGAYILVSLLLFIVGRICPAEWNNPYPCIEEPEELENQFSFKNSLWFTIGSIMQQGSEVAPIGLSTRMIAGSWWFFCLIIVSSYTANLAAFLVIESKQILIKSASDLLNNPHNIKYGAKAGGSTLDYFKMHSDPVYRQMYEYMMANKADVIMKSNDDGVARVLQGGYAFFMESSSIRYEAQRKCQLMQVGNPIDSKGYGIAMKKHSPYRNKLSTALLTLQETGVLRELENKWWSQKRGGGRCDPKKSATSEAEALGTDNVGGVFVVLITGTALSCLYTAWELLWEVGCTSIAENVSFKEELKEELKFAIKCSATSKPVRRRKGSSVSNQSNGEESVRGCSPPCGFVPTVVTTTPEDG